MRSIRVLSKCHFFGNEIENSQLIFRSGKIEGRNHKAAHWSLIRCEIGFKCFFLSSQGVPGYKSHKRIITRNVNCQLGVKFIQFDFKTLTKYKWNWNVIRIYLGLSVNTKNLHVEIICRILRQISSCGLNYSKIPNYSLTSDLGNSVFPIPFRFASRHQLCEIWNTL